MIASQRPALLLTRHEIAALMVPQDYLAAVEAGFRCYAHGNAGVPVPMHIAVPNGVFHAKGAHAVLDRSYVAVKLNGNFPGNSRRSGLPTIQGVVVLCDAADGSVLSVMDSIEITLRRTAAASALAARYLARSDAASVAICGCGMQGRAQLAALVEVLSLKQALVWDLDSEKANEFARTMRAELHLDVAAVREPGDATRQSDVIVTATTARAPFLTTDMVSPGVFVAAVGADSPEKSELAPQLMAAATIVVDVLAQCATMGDLHHAIEAGQVALTDVHAELADLVVERKPGRASPDEITVFDSTGTALQDVASAAAIYQRAMAGHIGLSINFGVL
jgi:alanine dehydrogenase